MEKCTTFLSTMAMLLFLTLLIATLPTDKEGAIYGDTLRLHILANSDSAEDQGLKLEIRDRLLEKYGEELKSLDTKDAAVRRLGDIKEDIRRDVDAWVAEAGYDYTSTVSLDTEWYDRREYGDYALPEGYYTSLKVELGDAEGQNWWCVMYPPICLDIATESAPAEDALSEYTKEEERLIGNGRYTVKFKLLELTSEIFAAFGR